MRTEAAAALNESQRERLRALARCTRYEVTAVNGVRILIGYTARNSRRGLWNALMFRPAELCAMAGADRVVFAAKASDGCTLGPWHINFSGRTERDAIMQGEYPRVPQLEHRA